MMVAPNDAGKQPRDLKAARECMSPSSGSSKCTLSREAVGQGPGVGNVDALSPLPEAGTRREDSHLSPDENTFTSSAGTDSPPTTLDGGELKRGSPSRPSSSWGSGRSKYGFRFLKAERKMLEDWYRNNDSQTPKIGIRKQWAHKWNAMRKAHANEEDAEYKVNHQQIKQWFENTRRSRNASRRRASQESYPGGSGGVGAPLVIPAPSLNPNFYLSATSEKMRGAIQLAWQVVCGCGEVTGSLSEGVKGISTAALRWDTANLKAVVNKLVGLTEHQSFSPSMNLAAPGSMHNQLFTEMLKLDLQVEAEWDALRSSAELFEQGSAADRGGERYMKVSQEAEVRLDAFMAKYEEVANKKLRLLTGVMNQLPMQPYPQAASTAPGEQILVSHLAQQGPSTSGGLWGAAHGGQGNMVDVSLDLNKIQSSIPWTRAWAIPPQAGECSCQLTSKLCLFQGCHLEPEQRANHFLGFPCHLTALASAVCFGMESEGGEMLTVQAAQNLVSLYESAARNELKLSDQLDHVWNLNPGSPVSGGHADTWRLWLETHHSRLVYYPLKAVVDSANGGQSSFHSAMRSSLKLSLDFLAVMRRVLPLALFIRLVVNITQAQYLFAASTLVRQYSAHRHNSITRCI